MVIPYEHVALTEDMCSEALSVLMLTANRVTRLLRTIAEPQGFNLGANIGEAAGADIAPHFHFHAAPRWSGDANFMLTVGGTQTVSDRLTNTAR